MARSKTPRPSDWDEVAEVIDLGIDCLGVPLNASSKTFRERYDAADVIVAKGQAAYQTLEGDDAPPRRLAQGAILSPYG